VSEAEIVAWGESARAALEQGGAEAIQAVRAFVEGVYVSSDEIVIVPTFALGAGNQAQRGVTLQGMSPYARFKRSRRHSLRRVRS
jgi:hypothetical protein